MIRLKKFANHHTLGVHKERELKQEIQYFEDELKKATDPIDKLHESLVAAKAEGNTERIIYFQYALEEAKATAEYARHMLKVCNKLLNKVQGVDDKIPTKGVED